MQPLALFILDVKEMRLVWNSMTPQECTFVAMHAVHVCLACVNLSSYECMDVAHLL